MKLAEQVLDIFEGRLLGSAPSKEEIIKGINKFWYDPDGLELIKVDDKTYKVSIAKKGVMDGFIVKVVKGRWRFETV